MYSNQSVFSVSKTSIFLFSIFMMICSMVPTTDLQAAGWGKSQDVFEYEGTKWNGVYLNLDGLNAVATIPNFSGARLQDGSVWIDGSVEEGTFDDIVYLIETPFKPQFDSPLSQKEFVRLLQELYPDSQINVVDARTQGVSYVLEMISTDPEDIGFWRIFTTKNRLLMMGTNDSNELRRLAFFDSLYIE